MSDDGAYRWKWWSIHDVCEDVNGSCRGTSDPLPTDQLREMADWLRWRIEHWTPSFGGDRFIAYDNAVSTMAAAAFQVAVGELNRRVASQFNEWNP